MAIHPQLSTNDWEQVECLSPDITAIRIQTDLGWTLIANVYNPCEANSSLPWVRALLGSLDPNREVVLLGDFNRHHPLWDKERNRHLFTPGNLDLAQPLIDLTAEYNLSMVLPKDIPTLQSASTKNYTRTDNVFASDQLAKCLVECNTAPERRPPRTDHIPIQVTFKAVAAVAREVNRRNFREANWEKFGEELEGRLRSLPGRARIRTQEELDSRTERLTEAIQEAVAATIPLAIIVPHTKRWWRKGLTNLRRETRRLANSAYRRRDMPEHPVHAEYRRARNVYAQEIKDAKKAHWEGFLEDLDDDTIWVAGRFVGSEPQDGGAARIPNLKYTDDAGELISARDNTAKCKVLLDAFFLAPPDAEPLVELEEYPEPVQDLPEISIPDIKQAIERLKPFKAPGPDNLPACIYKHGMGLLVDHLLPILRASIRLGIYPAAWKKSRTIVLRKPGKPSYSVAKAYRPIALLNVSSKIFSTCIAERLKTLADRHVWLPEHHFGGRAGRTTTDALHLFVKTVKDAWARGQVASALFLDVKGAFPHALPARLADNMRKLGIPSTYVKWMLAKLDGRTTCLAFDDFESEQLPVRNGIDQGCPLSVIFYLLYNSGLVRVPKKKGREMCLAYIDDVTYLAWGDDFQETHATLQDMMSRPGGALEWSATHYSEFELDKTACIDFSRTKGIQRPNLAIGQHTISPTRAHTLLGVCLDQELRWKDQVLRAVAKGTAWVSQLSCLAKTSYGASPSKVRRLYLSIAIPRFAYAVDIWYSPVTLKGTARRGAGLIGIANKLARIQNIAARAILGVMRSTPVDTLNAFSSLAPIHLLLNDMCHNSALRLASAPPEHPLYKAVLRCARGRKRHVTPLQHILKFANIHPRCLEKWQIGANHKVVTHMQPFPTKQIAKTAALRDDTYIKVFTDGSRRQDKAGAAALLYEGTTRRLIRFLSLMRIE
jgi:hypothetical protein